MLEGAFNYLKTYPYNCWEQNLTKAVMASYSLNLKGYFDTKKISWVELEKLPKEIISQAKNFQAPNGGMSYYRRTLIQVYLSAYTAYLSLGLNQLVTNSENIESKLHEYLDFIEKMFFQFFNKGCLQR